MKNYSPVFVLFFLAFMPLVGFAQDDLDVEIIHIEPACESGGSEPGGLVTINITGGVPPYTIELNNGGVYGTEEGVFTLGPFWCGNYIAIITDANGQSFFAYLNIPCIPSIPYNIESNADEVCDENPFSHILYGQAVSEEALHVKVCEYSTISFFTTFLEYPSGVIDETEWLISGADSYETTFLATGSSLDAIADVHWGEAGQGSAAIEFYDGQCQESIPIQVEILPTPQASFITNPPSDNNLLTICAGQSVFFENTSLDAASIAWDFGTFTTEVDNITLPFDEPGTFTVLLSAFSDCNCSSDTTAITIEVIELDNPNVDCIGTVCAGETITYTSDAECGIFNWNISGNGLISEGGGVADNFVTINWTDGAVGIIELQVADCPSGSICSAPTSVQIPIISDNGIITGVNKVCKGTTEVYSTPAYETTEFVWEVSNGGNIISGQGSNEITVYWSNDATMPQQYVKVTYENCYLDCNGAAELIVNIRPRFYLTGTNEVCQNTTENYQVLTVGTDEPVNCIWSIQQNGNTIMNLPEGSGTLIDWDLPAGTYQLIVYPISTWLYCESSYTIPVFVRSSSPPADNITGENLVCTGYAYLYEAVGVADANFEWVIDDGGSITTRSGNPITVVWQNAPPYSLSVRQINTGSLPCVSEPFVLDILPITNLELSGDIDVCKDEVSSIQAPFYTGINYQWNIEPAAAGTIIGNPDLNQIQILWATAGDATVSVSTCGQSSTVNVTVHNLPVPVVQHPAFICPDDATIVSTVENYAAYFWKDTLGSILSTSPTPALSPGHYQVEVEDALGCRGTVSFEIQPYPSPSIHISTPVFLIPCNEPLNAPIIASDWTEGYQFEWYQDNLPIGFNNMSQITATTYGDYQVLVTDDNGCSKFSNVVHLQCFTVDTLAGVPVTGEGIDLGFSIIETTCNEHQFINESSGYEPGSIVWIRFGSSNLYEENPMITYTEAGFYHFLLAATFDGEQFGILGTDTIAAVANFEWIKVCQGQATDFFNTSTFLPFVNITSYEWDFGDPTSGVNNTSTAENPQHIYTDAGSYTVNLTINTDFDCFSITSQVITVAGPPDVYFDEPSTNCAATATPFLAITDADVFSIEWNFGDASSGEKNTSTRTQTYHQYDTPGTYTVTLTAENYLGCSQTFSRDIVIEPNGLIGDIAVLGSVVLCEGDSVTLTAPDGGVAWEWSNGENTESVTIGEEDIYEVTVTDEEGCTYTPFPVVVTVIPLPEVPIRALELNEFGGVNAFHYDTYETCYGEDVHIEFIQNPSYEYEWIGGESNVVIFGKDGLPYLETGGHNISVMVTDVNSGCVDSSSIEVIVHPLPENVQIIAFPGGLICEGTATNFQVVNPDADLDYFWNTGKQGSSITAEEAGEYFVTAISAFGCKAESNHITITEGPDIQKIPGGCHTRCKPDTICLPPLEGVTSYQWFFEGNPIAAPLGNIPELIINESGAYYVEMVSDLGCTLTSEPLVVELYDGYGTIAGQFYFDANHNGMIDAADSLLNGIDIQLMLDGLVVDDQVSIVEGYYNFNNILSTDYSLALDSLSFPDGMMPVISTLDTALIGCDDFIQLNWLFDCIEKNTTLELTGCHGESIEYEGVSFLGDTSFTVNYFGFLGCDSIETVSIEFDDLPSFEAEVQPSCFDISSGEISILPSGGTSPYTYAIDGGVFQSSTIFENLEAGTYEIIIKDSLGCNESQTITIDGSSALSIATAIEPSCFDSATGEVMVSATGGTPPFQYSIDGETFLSTAVFENIAAGNYEITVVDTFGCSQIYEITLDEKDQLLVEGKDKTIGCDTPEPELTVNVLSGGNDVITYLWDTGSTDSTIIVQEEGAYSLMISNDCESVETTVNVTRIIEDPTEYFYIPNAFSPNGDNINDAFGVFYNPAVEFTHFKLELYDRWGDMMFDADNPEDFWDGTYRGKKRNVGVYVWYLEVGIYICGRNAIFINQGDVLLVK